MPDRTADSVDNHHGWQAGFQQFKGTPHPVSNFIPHNQCIIPPLSIVCGNLLLSKHVLYCSSFCTSKWSACSNESHWVCCNKDVIVVVCVFGGGVMESLSICCCCCCFCVCVCATSWTRMLCKIFLCYHDCEGQSEGSCNQNITISAVSSDVLVLLQPNFVGSS